MHDQYPAVGVRKTVRRVVQDVPRAACARVNHHVLAVNCRTRSKRSHIRLGRVLHRTNCNFIARGLAVNTNRQPAICSNRREHCNERRVDAARQGSAKGIVVKTCFRRNRERIHVVAEYRTHKVVCVQQIDVHTVRRLTRYKVCSVFLNRQCVAARCTATFTAAVIARTIIVCSVAVVVASAAVCAARYFKLITRTVAVCIRQAHAVAVVARSWTVALTVTRTIGDAVTAANAALIQHVALTIASTLGNAVSSTNTALIQFRTAAVIRRSVRIVVARRAVRAAKYLCVVANAVAVRIRSARTAAYAQRIQDAAIAVASAFGNAIAAAYPALVKLQAAAVVLRSICIVVARRTVCAACGA